MTALASDQQRRVLDGAVNLFSKCDLESITLDQLTRTCGVSAFDIVRHYHTKENIVAAVLERELELIAGAAHAPELRFPGETMRDELQVLAKMMLQECRARLPLLARLLSEAMRNPEVGALFYRKFIMQGRLLFTEFLKCRGNLGELREDLDVEAAAAMFLSSLLGILLMAELFGGKHVEQLDDDRVVRELSCAFLEGVIRR